jgi:hypothetical protein
MRTRGLSEAERRNLWTLVGAVANEETLDVINGDRSYYEQEIGSYAVDHLENMIRRYGTLTPRRAR